MALSDPNTRPDEETVFIPTSFDLEPCTSPEVGLLLEELGLRRGDLSVTIHQSSPTFCQVRGERAGTARRRGCAGVSATTASTFA
ncbi:unnamed protein product [Urochloa humidicola]